MASLFNFRTRSPNRDRQTDELRFQQLFRCLDQITAEIEAESAGIRNRYETVSANAAFLADAMDNDAAPSRQAGDIDRLTDAIKACHRRIGALGAQSAFVDRLRHLVDTFVAEGRRAAEEPPAGETPGRR